MIQEFSVVNYRSIKTKQTINFLANKKMNRDLEDYLCVPINDTTTLLKLGLLYGHNASGKSNMLMAIDFLRKLVISGPEKKNENTGFVPFLFDSETSRQPGRFSLIFFINKTKYVYSVTVGVDKICEESLYYVPEGRITKLYTRTFNEESKTSRISIGTKCSLSAKEKTILSGNTLENVTVLSAYQRSNLRSNEFDKVVSYFTYSLMSRITPKALLRNWSLDKLSADNGKKGFYVKLLEKADVQISDIEVKDSHIEVTDKLLEDLSRQGAPRQVIDALKEEKQIESKELFFMHTANGENYQLPSTQESQGTLRYFGLSGVLNEMIAHSHFVSIDEIESSLHPDLVVFFLQMFLMNTKKSQLLATTHLQSVMDQDYVRNDMIWFCEKDKAGGSNYYCAQEFKQHKNVSTANSYRVGKYGAKPILGSPIIEED